MPRRRRRLLTLAIFARLALGLLFLTLGADWLVRGASRLATALGVRPLLVGLTVVAFGTSAPEVAVSVEAALAGTGDVALGNVVGSNIFNVLLVLGLAAVVRPLLVQKQLVRLDVPVMIGVSILPLLLALDGRLGRIEASALLAGGFLYVGVLALLARRDGEGAPESGEGSRKGDGSPGEPGAPTAPPEAPSASWWDGGRVILGLAGLVLGATLLIDSATVIARAAGVSELVIGLTLVAASTSLPEAATSIVAGLKGERDLAVGNVVGSNIFNVLFVLGAAGAVVPSGLEVPPGALTFDFPIMIAVALACLPIFFTGGRISRGEGLVFLAYYAIYLVYLFLDASMHDARDEFGAVVLFAVLPFTLLVGLVAWIGSRRDRPGAP